MESVQEVLERRWVSRTLSMRDAQENRRKHARRGLDESAARLAARREQHISACAEVEKIARDLGITLDKEALNQRVQNIQDDIEQVAQAFKEV